MEDALALQQGRERAQGGREASVPGNFFERVTQGVVGAVDNALVRALTHHEEVLSHKIAAKVQETVQTVGQELIDRAVPSAESAQLEGRLRNAEEKLGTAMNVVKMLMMPCRSRGGKAGEDGGKDGGGEKGVHETMKPFVDCARMSAAMKFDKEELEDMFGKEDSNA